jgi:phosphorylase kinase gamma subunit
VDITLFPRLAGFPPFWHKKKMLMIRAIMNGKFQFGSPEWDDISESAKDLIKKLLTLNVAERLTADEALAHPWMSITQQPREHRFSARTRFRVEMNFEKLCHVHG